jgi:hypothetical protein
MQSNFDRFLERESERIIMRWAILISIWSFNHHCQDLTNLRHVEKIWTNTRKERYFDQVLRLHSTYKEFQRYFDLSFAWTLSQCFLKRNTEESRKGLWLHFMMNFFGQYSRKGNQMKVNDSILGFNFVLQTVLTETLSYLFQWPL